MVISLPNFVAQRKEQVVGMLLSTMPLAERMLFYNLAMAAMVMLPFKPTLAQGLNHTRH
jgi:hypothetical protein